MTDTRNQTMEEEARLSQDWFERAEEAARRFNLPISENEDTVSPEEVERNLRRFEQDGGE